MITISELLKSGKASIVDVRTPEEFATGHVAKSINIPLNVIPSYIDEFVKMNNIIVCCASGVRSQRAATLLKQNGIECYNGGSWLDVNRYVNTN